MAISLTLKAGRGYIFRLVKQTAEREIAAEQLKAENAMIWVQQMNDIRNRAKQIVNNEIIFYRKYLDRTSQ